MTLDYRLSDPICIRGPRCLHGLGVKRGGEFTETQLPNKLVPLGQSVTGVDYKTF